MRLTLIISSLTCGGAERAAVLLAEGFLRENHQVSLITLAGVETDFYNLPDKVHRLALNITGDSPTIFHALWNNISRLWIIRKAIRLVRPEVVISFLHQTNILTLLASLNTSYPVIVSEQNNPDVATEALWKKLRRVTYPYSARVVSTSQGVDAYFDWLPKTKRAVIYNPLTLINEQVEASFIEGAALDKKWIISMGRLVYQKGFDILLAAFQQIAIKHLDWQLIILGEGELRPELEALKVQLGNQVILPGLVSNPFPILKRAQLFVLSSRFEGFGNVLIEAMACGLAVISTDCPSGPQEIIRDQIDGILVPNEDVAALAVAMDRLMSDQEERQRLASRAPEIAERFQLEKVIGTWEALIEEVLSKNDG